MKKISFIKNVFITVLLLTLAACSNDDNAQLESNNKQLSKMEAPGLIEEPVSTEGPISTNLQTFAVSKSIFRLFSPSANKHFYTTATSGPAYSLYPVGEGTLGSVLSEYDSSIYNLPIYVCFNPGNYDRIMTVSVSEHNYLLALGWVNEGIMGYTSSSFPSPMNSKKIYRYFNPSRAEHFYTNNFNELGAGRYGYSYEGVAFQLVQQGF